ncbi:GIY-YIG nuclease family protein [Bradyrhizobium niftali]|uniref:GIY-YIG nuclease family protein n=1 Tax=Bradyrhizobium niftali TaxID=2560055 RepID=UPI0038513AD7
MSKRVDEHNAGAYPGYTFSRRPVVLVWSEYFDRITDGIAVERQLKGRSRVKTEAFVRSDGKSVSQFARRCAGAPRPKK